MLTSLVLTMQAYMVELYQDTLLDLLLPKNAKHSRLDIKKDTTVMIPMLRLLCFSNLVKVLEPVKTVKNYLMSLVALFCNISFVFICLMSGNGCC